MWVIKSRKTQLEHIWHKTYSVGPIRVLGKPGCIMTYEIMVIDTAERNWKLVKVVNSVQRDTTITLKSKQHTLVYGTNH